MWVGANLCSGRPLPFAACGGLGGQQLRALSPGCCVERDYPAHGTLSGQWLGVYDLGDAFCHRLCGPVACDAVWDEVAKLVQQKGRHDGEVMLREY